MDRNNSKGLTKKRILIIIGVLLVVIAPLLISSGYILQACILVVMYAYWACSWNIISGYCGQLSLGHGVYIVIGAYVSTILYNQYGVSPWLGMIVGGVIAGGVAVLVSFPCFKLTGTYFTLSTLAFLHVVRLYITNNDSIFGFKTNGAQGLKVSFTGDSFLNMQFLDKTWYLYIILGFLALILFVSYKIKNSKMGYYLFAIKTNQTAAASLGINVRQYKLKAMFISAFFTALGGSFYAQLMMFLDPTTLAGANMSTNILIFAVIGGVGTLWGPVIGAVIMVPVNEITRLLFGTSMAGLSGVIYGCVFLLVVFFMPNGLVDFIMKRSKKKNDGGKQAVLTGAEGKEAS